MISDKRITQRKPLSDFFDSAYHPLINRLYANRGIRSSGELDYSLKNLPRPELLTGMSQACELLFEALLADANILIVGDYDVDGATSTCLTKLALESFGFNHIAYFIPDRLSFGYGLSVDVIQAVQQFQADLVITVDNGISSHDGIELARQLGISVIVTDHHLPSESLPQADAIINPNLPNDKFPGKKLAGVGVAFYFMLGLRTYLRQQNWFKDENIKEPTMVEYLDLVALGTIADVVGFDYVNRLLVHQGMQRINRQQCCQGIQALAAVCDKQINTLNTTDIAFNIAPRINAAGRLEDMSVGVECLLSGDAKTALKYAHELNAINEQRKTQQDESNQQAIEQINQEFENELELDNVSTICLYKKNWHPGIVGLIASRLKESFNLPSIIFADDDQYLKGSARSIKGIHIRDVLATIDSSNPGLIEKFGGHAMAAGLSIKKQEFDQFKSVFEQLVTTHYATSNNAATIVSDGELAEADFNLEVCELLQQSGPWGHEFESPLFDNHFEVIDCHEIGKNGGHLRFKLKHSDDSKIINAVAFNYDRYLKTLDLSINNIHAVYQLDINRYNNLQNLQLIIHYFDINS